MLLQFTYGGRLFKPSDEAELLEAELGLEKGYIAQLASEPDFEFFLKFSALVEASIRLLLRSRISVKGADLAKADDAIARFVDRMPLGGRQGLVELARDLGLMSEKEFGAINFLIEVRNRYAHSPKSMGQSLTDLCGDEALRRRLQGMISKEVVLGATPHQVVGMMKLWLWLMVGNYCAFCQFRRRPLTFFEMSSTLQIKSPD